MKKITTALLTIGLFSLTLASCKKDNEPGKIDDAKDLNSTKMTYKVNGTAKTSKQLFAVKDDAEQDLAIYGAVSDSEEIILSIGNFQGTGDYAINGDEVSVAYTTGSNYVVDSYLGYQGNIKVTSVTGGQVKGTFLTTVKNSEDGTKEITEGSFEAKIVQE